MTEFNVDDVVHELGRSASEPEHWTVREPPESRDTWELVRSDGPVVCLRANGYRQHGRLTVSGRYPRDDRGQEYAPYLGRPEITVSLSRGAKAIAGEIRRRFLPLYLPAYWNGVAQKVKTEENRAKMMEVGEQLATALGVRVNERQGTDQLTLSWFGHPGWGVIEIYPGGTVSFKFSGLAPNQAEVMVKALKIYTDAKAEVA